jgi:hypothetical protein
MFPYFYILKPINKKEEEEIKQVCLQLLFLTK